MGEADQLSPDEIVYRRIPVASEWVKDGKVDPAAFLPNRSDSVGGISLAVTANSRDAAATGKRGKKYYAVSLRVGDLQARGLQILKDADNHAYIDGWVYENRKNLVGPSEYLCTICGAAEGPFDGEYDPPG